MHRFHYKFRNIKRMAVRCYDLDAKRESKIDVRLSNVAQ